MKAEQILRIVPGTFIIVSLVLYNFSNPDMHIFSSWNWLLLALFVGVNLFQSGFTKWCLLEKILKRLGY